MFMVMEVVMLMPCVSVRYACLLTFFIQVIICDTKPERCE